MSEVHNDFIANIYLEKYMLTIDCSVMLKSSFSSLSSSLLSFFVPILDADNSMNLQKEPLLEKITRDSSKIAEDQIHSLMSQVYTHAHSLSLSVSDSVANSMIKFLLYLNLICVKRCPDPPTLP